MKVGVIGAGTMGQGIAKAFAQNEGYEVALCDIKQEWADGGKEKIAKGYDRLVQKMCIRDSSCTEGFRLSSHIIFVFRHRKHIPDGPYQCSCSCR